MRSLRNASIDLAGTGAEMELQTAGAKTVCSNKPGAGASRMNVEDSGGSSSTFKKMSASVQRIVSAPSRMKMRLRPCGLKFAARCTARNCPMRIMGRATGVRKRTGSGTMTHTSGLASIINGMRSTIAASALSPRSARPASINCVGSVVRPTHWHEAHSPQKSSLRRSQLAACANIRASVNFPMPRGPVKSKALGTRSRPEHAPEGR